MREIVFRGKEINNKGWVYGALVQQQDDPLREKTLIISYSNYQYGDFSEAVIHEVDPETVGQYTGFVDKNGKKIFEGDVLKMNNTDLKCGAISFMRGSFCLTSIEERVIYRADIGYIEQCGVNRAEVIGNIYDNPELIKDGE